MVGLRERQGRLTTDDRERFFTLLAELRASRRLWIEPLDERLIFGRIWALSQRHGLTTYDAAYLELAGRRSLPLATFDGALQEAAGHEAVPLVGEPADRAGGPAPGDAGG